MAGGITPDEFAAEESVRRLKEMKPSHMDTPPAGRFGPTTEEFRRWLANPELRPRWAAGDVQTLSAADARTLYALYGLAGAVSQSLPELQRVLDDEANAQGWGPDVTMLSVLTTATTRLEDAMAALRATGYDPQ